MYAVPHQHWAPPLRRPAAPRWLRGCGREWGGWGWGRGGGGILASCPWDGHAMRAARSKQKAKFRFQGSKKRANRRSRLIRVEIVSSLIFAQNSGRRFQTHISNSGEQIPKHARQNSEGGRFPVSHYKTRSRGHRFLGTDFSILVSEFKFPARPRIWEASHFSFLDSQCKSKDAHGLEIAQF